MAKTESAKQSNVLASNNYMEARARIGYGHEKLQVALHERVLPDIRARFAMAMIEKWGLAAGTTDGEDSVGRQKARRLDPDEVVTIACDISERLFAQMSERGWLLDIGDMDTLKELASEEN